MHTTPDTTIQPPSAPAQPKEEPIKTSVDALVKRACRDKYLPPRLKYTQNIAMLFNRVNPQP